MASSGRPRAIRARAASPRVISHKAHKANAALYDQPMTTVREDVFLNGEFVTRDSARVSAFDAGIQHGVGLFETMRAVYVENDVQVHRLSDHLHRLQGSATTLALTESLQLDALDEAIVLTLERTRETGGKTSAARVRLTITGGDLNLLRAAKSGERGNEGGGAKRSFDPTLMIDVQPATVYPIQMYEHGVTVALADSRVNPLDLTAAHKTLSYWWRLRELQIAAGKGAAESLVFAVSNHAASGCVSNLLLVRNGVLLTPIARGEEPPSHAGGVALPSPVLPGVVRGAVLEAAAKRGLTVEKRMLSIDDVLDADEVMLTNSSWGVLPVVRVEATQIGSGKPGDVTMAMLEAVEAEEGMQGLRAHSGASTDSA